MTNCPLCEAVRGRFPLSIARYVNTYIGYQGGCGGQTREIRAFRGRRLPSLVTDTSDAQAAKTYTTKHGTVATMNTANIGASICPPMTDSPQPPGGAA